MGRALWPDQRERYERELERAFEAERTRQRAEAEQAKRL
jgi:hypothetical protein